MRLLLVPHALTQWNAEGRFQGHTDIPLNPQGRQQASRLRERLAQETIDIAFASDLRRAWDTAAAICEPRRQTVRGEPRLREMHFGSWEGLTQSQIQQRDAPCAYRVWEENGETEAPPGGETLTAIASRLREFLEQLVIGRQGSEQTILLVAHRGSLRVLLCLFLGLPPGAHWRFFLDSASLSELYYWPDTEKTILTCLNDTHHLREAIHAR